MPAPKANFKKLPNLTSSVSLSEDVRREIFKSLVSGDHVSPFNAFSVATRVKYNRPERLELKEIRITGMPQAGIDVRNSIMQVDGGKSIHVALVEKGGEAFGYAQASSGITSKRVSGAILEDGDKRTHLFLVEDGKLLDRPPFELNNEISPLLGETIGPNEQGMLPLVGDFTIGYQEILDFPNGMRGIGDIKDKRSPWHGIVNEARTRLDKIMARKADIGEIFDRHFTLEALRGVAKAGKAMETGQIVPAFEDRDNRKTFDDAIEALTRRFMEDLRTAGLLEKCPNNGPRDVNKINAWDAWLDGKLDKPMDQRAPKYRYMDMWLAQSPAFRVAFSTLVSVSVTDENKTIKSDAHLERALNTCIQTTRIAYRDEVVGGIGSVELNSGMNGDRLHLMGSVLRPVLGAYEAGSYTLKELPPAEALKPVRHMELEITSGKMIVADWIRAEGFNEGVKILLGEEFFDINSATGMDESIQAHYEKAGLIYVPVGNSSPYAFTDDEGLIRMGSVDEDHDDFWLPSGESTGLPIPKEAWTTCTDLWANTLADKEVIIDVMMVSGLHASRSDAESALDAYIDETYGANEVEMDVGTHHLYVPTGDGNRKGNFLDVFQADGVDQRDWQLDEYIISNSVLDVDPDVVDDPDWTTPAREIEVEGMSL